MTPQDFVFAIWIVLAAVLAVEAVAALRGARKERRKVFPKS